jgi:hypothetical protein
MGKQQIARPLPTQDNIDTIIADIHPCLKVGFEPTIPVV